MSGPPKLGTIEPARGIEAVSEVLCYTDHNTEIELHQDGPTVPLNSGRRHFLVAQLLGWERHVKFVDDLHRAIDGYCRPRTASRSPLDLRNVPLSADFRIKRACGRKLQICLSLVASLLAMLCIAAPARGQEILNPQPPLPAASRIELSVGAWWPTAHIMGSGEKNGVQGTPIDFNREFGFPTPAIPEFGLTLRAARRHKVRAGFFPLQYVTSASLSHDLTFAGSVYPAGTRTIGTITWRAVRASYEYDIIVRRRLYVGVIAEIDRTNIKVRLQSAAADELTSSSVPTIPTVGGVFGFSPTRRITLTSEFTNLYVPDRPNQTYGGHYLSIESVGTLTMTEHIGARLALRAIDIRHLGPADSGTLKLNGLSLGVAVRWGTVSQAN
jgi:hypothetical protein